MKIVAIIILMLLGTGAYYLMAQKNPGPSPPAGFESIDPVEAKRRLGTEPNIILLDVRTPEEYAEQHIPGSMLIPLDQLEQKVAPKIPAKNSKVFIYCRTGRRSKLAANILIKLGYTNVYDLGGIIDWPFEKETGP